MLIDFQYVYPDEYDFENNRVIKNKNEQIKIINPDNEEIMEECNISQYNYIATTNGEYTFTVEFRGKTASVSTIIDNFIIVENPIKHADQSEENNAIGIDKNGETVNMDLWYYILEENGYNLTGPSVNEYGNSRDYGGCSYKGEFEDGKIQGEIPMFIKSDENSGFFPITKMYSTFINCKELTEVTIPESVTSIGVYAFDGCTSLTSITIPESVTSIGAYAFNGCTSLTSITIPESVTSIANWVFNGCTSLTSITIPESVTSIADRVFYGCTSLTNVNISNSTLLNNGADIFFGTLWWENKRNERADKLVIIDNILIDGRICSGNITIPNEVTSIGNYAFYENENLTSITIPNSVTSIGVYAFEWCSNLTSITIPGSVTSIGGYAFFETPWLDNKRAIDPLVIVNNILIDGGTCTGNITIPSSVTSIGEKAFFGCDNLTGITIPESVTSIGVYAFEWCSNLTSITIPHSVINVGSQVFYGDRKLIYIDVQGFTSKPAGWANNWNSECSATVYWGQ